MNAIEFALHSLYFWENGQGGDRDRMTNHDGEHADLSQRCYRFALSLTHNTALAEDLVQDAWVSTLKAKGEWNHRYLFRAIRTRFIDWLRKHKKISFHEFEKEPPDTSGRYWELALDVKSMEIGDENLDRALRRLNPDERNILFLFAVEDYSAAEIASLVERPRGTILSILSRARKKVADIRESNFSRNES